MDRITHRLPGLALTDHAFVVPLDHASPNGDKIEIFAREVVAAGREDERLPWLVFFQGGPGQPSPRPLVNDGWLKRAVRDYRVLLLDQRGTGRSTPVNFQTLARLSTPQATADYLRFFRADAIVRDAECIRRELLGENERWSVLGQSYGGFCITTYLSVAPQALKEAVITGGLPPIYHTADEVYRSTYRTVAYKNRLYYERYPDDVERVQAIADFLDRHDVRLPNGGRLSSRRFQQLGMGFGASDGFERVHYMLEDAFVTGAAGRELNHSFMLAIENAHNFESNPIYAVLHEACYCQRTASSWSAERIRAEFPEYKWSAGKQMLFTGEMVYPWMFDDYVHLQPLKPAADLLAEFDDWPPLYDPDALRSNTVPCAATIYYNDMYVDRAFALETAQTIRGIRTWVTDEYEHNALRSEGERVLDRLLGMVHGEC
ncbi:MAG: alpha/beta hydrolase [Chloroflexi bacterium]|nr:alpha/beta hydrolase [Chloroflexota bacterium]